MVIAARPHQPLLPGQRTSDGRVFQHTVRCQSVHAFAAAADAARALAADTLRRAAVEEGAIQSIDAADLPAARHAAKHLDEHAILVGAKQHDERNDQLDDPTGADGGSTERAPHTADSDQRNERASICTETDLCRH